MLPKTASVLIIILAICTLGVVPSGVNLVFAAPEDVALFQDVLARYGQWLNYGQYGSVWRPAQVSNNWRPYSNGRWVPSQEGYLFETDEPWGWATYHYGNWMPTNEHGWVWVPGRTWYPHTVNWRTSDENVGWSPVPPPEYGGSDNYYSGGYADGGYNYPSGSNSYGSYLNPSTWLFTQAADFLLGWGQPYSSAYSYANAGVLASPQYIPSIYERTVFVNNFVTPSYAPTAYYNWGPPVTYITKVTNIKNIDIERGCRDLRLSRLKNVVPPGDLRHRHPAWREIWPNAAANREVRVRPIPHQRLGSAKLNRPDAIPVPSALNRRHAGLPGASVASGVGDRQPAREHYPATRPVPSPDNNRPFQPGTRPDRPQGPYPASLTGAGAPHRQTAGPPAAPTVLGQTPPAPGSAIRQQSPASPPYQARHRSQPAAPVNVQENHLGRQQADRLHQDQQRADQELRLRQRLDMERRQQQARVHRFPDQQQVPGQPPRMPSDHQRRHADMQSQPQMQQRQAEMIRQQQAQAQQQRQAEMQRQQQMQQQQQRQAEMQRQQQMQMQQQRQAEMLRARQMQQQQQMVRHSPPPPPPQQAPPPQRKQDNQKKH